MWMPLLSNWLSRIMRIFSRQQRPALGAPALPSSVDPELRDVFLTEIADIVRNVNKALDDWRSDFTNPQHSRALARAFHTLKGSAPIVGAQPLADLGLAAEHTAKRASQKRNPDPAQIQALEAAVAVLNAWEDAARRGLPAPADLHRVTLVLKKSQG